MTQAEFSYFGEGHLLARGRALVRGTRTSGGGRDKKHVVIEVECASKEAGAVAVILQCDGRINETCF